MYYCSARTYDPTTRQFLSKDPAKDDGEESAYQYCGGDPVGKVDPSGLAFWVAVAGGVIIVAGGLKFFIDVRSLNRKYKKMISGWAIYGEWGAWTKRNQPTIRSFLEKAAKAKYGRSWGSLTNPQRHAAHNDRTGGT